MAVVGSVPWIAALAASALLPPPQAAMPPLLITASPSPMPPAPVSLQRDLARRMTVPVMIDDKGPFLFVIDTGADRTVLSYEVARALSLSPSGTAMLHTISGVSPVETTRVPPLTTPWARLRGIEAPLIARRHIGGDGMIGLDLFEGKQVLLDFRKNSALVRPAERVPMGLRTFRVGAHARYGRLVLEDSSVRSRKLDVILDTGSQVSIGNSAFRAMIDRGGRSSEAVDLISVSGGIVIGSHRLLPALRVGGMEMHNVPVTFADAHPFSAFNLDERPTLILGMDLLRLFDRIVIDFANDRIYFTVAPGIFVAPGCRGSPFCRTVFNG